MLLAVALVRLNRVLRRHPPQQGALHPHRVLGDALEPLEGVSSVDVNWVWDPPWSPDAMTDEGRFLMKVMGYG